MKKKKRICVTDHISVILIVSHKGRQLHSLLVDESCPLLARTCVGILNIFRETLKK